MRLYLIEYAFGRVVQTIKKYVAGANIGDAESIFIGETTTIMYDLNIDKELRITNIELVADEIYVPSNRSSSVIPPTSGTDGVRSYDRGGNPVISIKSNNTESNNVTENSNNDNE